jgi:nitric oxide reductase NorD protein
MTADAAMLAAIERPLSLFASAMAGRPLGLCVAGAAACSDAVTLALPRALLVGRHPGQPWGALRIELLRQVVDRLPGGRWGFRLDEAAARGLVGPYRPARDDAGDDARDPLSLCLATWPRPVLLRRLLRMVDAVRVDAIIAQRYPGVRTELQQLQQAASARLVRRQSCRAQLQREALAAAAALGRSATVYDSLQLAIALTAPFAMGWRRGLAQPRRLRIADAEEARSPGVTGIGAGRGGVAFRPQSGVTLPQGQGAAGGPATSPSVPAGPADGARDAPPAALAIAAGAPPQPREPAEGMRHDEWHYLERRYLRAWTRVHEHRLHGTELQYLAQLRQRHGELAAGIRRRIGKLRPRRRERARRLADGDDIDLDAAIQARIERRAGQADDPRVYTATLPTRRDVSAAFLLDVSGSTSFVLPDAQAPAVAGTDADDDPYFFARPVRVAPARPLRRVIDVAKDAIGLMCDALARLGDRHAVYGFSGEGRQQVDFYIAKGFDDGWSAHSAAALAAMQPKGSTRTGAAIRHAVGKLRHELAHTRLLIVLTDGYPQDSDYGPDPKDIDYGLRDTAQAMHEAERAGIAVFCVSVDHAAHDYLRRVCAPSRYLVIDDVQALPEQLSKVYRRLAR